MTSRTALISLALAAGVVTLAAAGYLYQARHGQQGEHGQHPGHEEHGKHEQHAGHSGHHGHGELDPGAFVTDSIFHLETRWIDADGATHSLAQALSGQPTVAAMIYTSCGHACPVIVSDMMKIRQTLNASQAGVRFVLFSFDPERDTPARMQDYQGEQGIGEWTILAPADPGAERELAAALGVRFKPIPGGDFAHSNLIFILDANGVPRHRQVGLQRAPNESVAVLHNLLKP